MLDAVPTFSCVPGFTITLIQTGTRSATANARVLLHQPHGGVSGSARDIEIHARESVYLRRRLEEILAERTGQPVERIKEDTDRDFWLTAQAAKEYGLIDEVVPAPRRLSVAPDVR